MSGYIITVNHIESWREKEWFVDDIQNILMIYSLHKGLFVNEWDKSMNDIATKYTCFSYISVVKTQDMSGTIDSNTLVLFLNQISVRRDGHLVLRRSFTLLKWQKYLDLTWCVTNLNVISHQNWRQRW